MIPLNSVPVLHWYLKPHIQGLQHVAWMSHCWHCFPTLFFTCNQFYCCITPSLSSLLYRGVQSGISFHFRWCPAFSCFLLGGHSPNHPHLTYNTMTDFHTTNQHNLKSSQSAFTVHFLAKNLSSGDSSASVVTLLPTG